MVAVTTSAAVTDATDAATIPTATMLILVLLPMLLLLLLLYNAVATTTALVHAPALTAAHTHSTTDTISDASDAPGMILILPSSRVIGITKWHEAAPLSE